MIIKRNSKLHKFNVWMSSDWKMNQKKDLCSYFWITVKHVLQFFSGAALALVILAFLTIVLVTIGNALLAIVGMYPALTGFPSLHEFFIYLGVGLTSMLLGIGVVAGTIFAWTKSKQKRRKAMGTIKDSVVHSTPIELVRQKVKAYKDKNCPLIEYRD